jgi:hypothetical protein
MPSKSRAYSATLWVAPSVRFTSIVNDPPEYHVAAMRSLGVADFWSARTSVVEASHVHALFPDTTAWP